MGINEIIKIGSRIKMLRKATGLSQKKMAELCDIPVTTYSNYENNNREPNINNLKKIADILEVSLDDLLGIHESIDDIILNHNLSGLPDILGEYTHEIGEFLYDNPKHKLLFDSAMEVKTEDVDFAIQMLDRINGKVRREED